MTSTIDRGIPANAASLLTPAMRANFNAAANDIEALQFAYTAQLAGGGAYHTYPSVAAAQADSGLAVGTYYLVAPSTNGGTLDCYQKNSPSTSTYIGTISAVGTSDAVAAAASAVSNAAAAAASAGSAATQASTATSQATNATSSAASAATQAGLATAAASSTALYKIYATMAAATADLTNIPANGWVEVAVDESQSNQRTRYQKLSGALSLMLTFTAPAYGSPTFPSPSLAPSGAMVLQAIAGYDINVKTSGQGAMKLDVPAGISIKAYGADPGGPDYGGPTFTVVSGTYTSATGVISLTMSSAPGIGPGISVGLSGITGVGVNPALIARYVTQSGTTGTTVVLQGPTGLGNGTITGGTIKQYVVGGVCYRQPTEAMQTNFLHHRCGQYCWETDDASWMAQLTQTGFNIGSPNSLTSTPMNALEVGGGDPGHPNGFFGNAVFSTDWARAYRIPDNSIAVGQSVIIGNLNIAYQTTTIVSGSYNSSTGLVTLTLTADVGLNAHGHVTISGATGTGNYSYINGTFVTNSGTAGTTLTFTIGTGLTMTITGGSVQGAPLLSLQSLGCAYFAGIGAGVAAFKPVLPVEAHQNSSGWPVTSGATQTYGSIRVKANDSSGLMDMGVNGGSGGWIVSSNIADLGIRYPIILGDGGAVFVGYRASNGSYPLQVNGQIFATSSTIATSDQKFKTDIEDIPGSLDLVCALRPRVFTWKQGADAGEVTRSVLRKTEDTKAEDGSVIPGAEELVTEVVRPAHKFPPGRQIGFIAQEVESVLADCEYLSAIVKNNASEEIKDENGNVIAPADEFKGIAEGNLIALLVGAVKELKAANDDLRARVAVLEKR